MKTIKELEAEIENRSNNVLLDYLDGKLQALKDVVKLIDKITNKEQKKIRNLILPMNEDNVIICLNNLAVEIKKEIEGKWKQ